jgi:ABC-type phosphate transport system substrate-binding protein
VAGGATTLAELVKAGGAGITQTGGTTLAELVKSGSEAGAKQSIGKTTLAELVRSGG